MLPGSRHLFAIRADVPLVFGHCVKNILFLHRTVNPRKDQLASLFLAS
jgi:hypothetical protein